MRDAGENRVGGADSGSTVERKGENGHAALHAISGIRCGDKRCFSWVMARKFLIEVGFWA